MALGFDASTRRFITQLPTITRPTGGGLTTLPGSGALPKTGLLARMLLSITGSVAGTITNPNTGGMASIIRRVRVTANVGLDLVNISGIGYHYLARNFHDLYFDPVPYSNARSAVTATTYDVSMLIEFMINQRDPIGLIPMQNEESAFTLQVEWEADANVGTGATVTGTCVPFLELFQLPAKREDWPALDTVQQLIEETAAISALGDFTYYWPRAANIAYLNMLHGVGIGVGVNADNWSRYNLRVNQTTYFYQNILPAYVNYEYALNHPYQRNLGCIPIDLYASSGVNAFGKFRDTISAGKTTDIASVITISAQPFTLYSVRKQLVYIGPPSQ